MKTYSNVIPSKAYSIAGRCQITNAEIMEVVANYYGLTPEVLQQKTRKTKIRKARQVTVWLCANNNLKHKSCEKPQPQWFKISEIFPGFHRTTFIHAYKAIEADIETNKEFSKEISELMRKLKFKALTIKDLRK